MSWPYLIQALNKCLSCTFLHKPAEGSLAHIDMYRYFSERDLLKIICIHVLKNLDNSSAI